MNKREKITSFKKILNSAQQLRAVCEQNLNIAARLESEANSALLVLGASTGQTRKSKVISQERKIQLLGNLTK